MDQTERAIRECVHEMPGMSEDALNFPWARVETPHRDFVGRPIRSQCPKCQEKESRAMLSHIEAAKVGNLMFDPHDTLCPTKRVSPVKLSYEEIRTVTTPTRPLLVGEPLPFRSTFFWIGQCPDCGTVLWAER